MVGHGRVVLGFRVRGSGLVFRVDSLGFMIAEGSPFRVKRFEHRVYSPLGRALLRGFQVSGCQGY